MGLEFPSCEVYRSIKTIAELRKKEKTPTNK